MTAERHRRGGRPGLPGVLLLLGMLAAGSARAAETGGVSSGGGSRSGSGVTLTDAVASVGGGQASGGGVVLRGGLLPAVTGITPVTLVSLSMARAEGGAPRLEWVLSADSDPSGFLVYRAAREPGPWTRITDRPLPPTARSYVDAAGVGDSEAWYRLAALSREGVEVLWAWSVSAPGGSGLPREVRLPPNVPNPFRTSTTLSVELPAAGPITLRIFDVSGRVVATLFEGGLEAGRHAFVWDGRGSEGRVAAGMYFGRLEALNQVRNEKILVTR